MTDTPLYLLRFEPIFKRLIWGGRRLETVLNKPLGEGHDYAESWEVADHRDDVSRVAEGPLKGTTLRELVQHRGRDLFGPNHGRFDHFPLLVKFLDAHDVLSVQVHPDDDLARRLVDDRGKTEAWVVMHAEPGSLIYAGLRAGVDERAFRDAVEADRVESVLHSFEPQSGDCVFVPAGTVHALGAGLVVAEVQQMSDATFRIHDWGRVGPDGQPRRLHLPEAFASIDFARGPVGPVEVRPETRTWGIYESLVACPHFELVRLRVTSPTRVGSNDRFSIIVATEGAARLRCGGQRFTIQHGETRLLPASVGVCDVEPEPQATLLICTTP